MSRSTRITTTLALILLLAHGTLGCAVAPSITPVPTLAFPARTPTLTGPAIPSRTATQTPAGIVPRATPSPSPTPTLRQPERSRTPVRFGLHPAAELGKGTAHDMAVSPDGASVAVASARGVFFYDAMDLTERAHLSTPAAATQVAYHPQGDAVLVGLSDGRIGMWSVPQQENLAMVQAHSGPVHQLACGPSGDVVVSLGSDGTLHIWTPGEEPLSLSIRGQTRFVLSPDGRHIAAGGDRWNREVILFEVATGRELARADVLPDLSGMAFSPDGQLLVASGAGGQITVLDTTSGASREIEGPPVIRGLAIHPDGHLMAVGAFGTSARVLDLDTGQTVAALPVSEQGLFPTFSADGQRLALSDAQGIRVWAVDSWQLIAHAEAHGTGPLAFAAGGASLVGLRGSTIAALDLIAGSVRLAPGHMDLTTSLAFAPDGSLLAVGDWQGLVHLIDLDTGRARVALAGHTGPVGSLSFSPDGATLASAGVNEDTTGVLWDVESGERLATLQGDPGYPLRPLIFDVSGGHLVGSGKNDVLVLDLSDGSQRRLSGHTEGTVSLAVSPDGSLLASGAFDERVIVWDIATGRPLYELPEHEMGAVSLGFSPGDALGLSGHVLFTGDQRGRVRLWAAEDGSLLQTIEARGNDVAPSPDGRLLAFKTTLDDITLWDVAAAREIYRVEARGSRPIAFSPDGRHIASGSPNGVVTLWRLSPE